MDMRNKQIAWWLVLLAVVSGLTASHFRTAASNFIWSDESYIVWSWYQPLPSFLLVKAITQSAAAPPLDFIFGSFFWRTLHFLAPAWSIANLELALRLYPMVLMGLGTWFLVLCIKRVLNSWTAALLIAVFFTRISPSINYYFSEVRFYAALYLFSIFCWWTYLRVLETLREGNEKRMRNALRLYLLTGAIGLWVHIYTLMVLAPTMIALLWTLLSSGQPKFLIVSRLRLSLIAFVVNGLIWAAWLRTCPLLKLRSSLTLHDLLLAWSATMNELMPHFLLASLLVLFGSFAGLLWKPRLPQRTSLLIYPAVFFSTLFVAFTQLTHQYFWEPRYIFYLMPSFVMGTVEVLAGTIDDLERRADRFWQGPRRFLVRFERPGVALGVSVLLLLVLPENNWRPYIPGGDEMVQIRKTLWNSRAHVRAVAGLEAIGEHTETRRVALAYGVQIYSSGIQDVPILTTAGENRLLARLSRRYDSSLAPFDYLSPREPGHPRVVPRFSCAEAEHYPVIDGNPRQGEDVIVDFCPVEEQLSLSCQISTVRVTKGPVLRRYS